MTDNRAKAESTQVNDEQNQFSRTVMLYLLNVLIAMVGPMLLTIFGAPWDHVIAFFAAFVVIGLFDHTYARRCVRIVIFLLYVAWKVILSNISLAWLIIRPRLQLNPGIVGVPLTVTNDFEITTLATVITLTPGTLSVDLLDAEDGGQVLYVHSILVGDEDEFRADIQSSFEHMILQISRGE